MTSLLDVFETEIRVKCVW